jgi:hypothetical protein
MAADSKACKFDTLYWIKYRANKTGKVSKWVQAHRCKDIEEWKLPLHYVFVRFDDVVEIGPEIVPPPEPEVPGIYRVLYNKSWYAAEFNVDGWRIAGYGSNFGRHEFTTADYLGPFNPEEPASDTND